MILTWVFDETIGSIHKVVSGWFPVLRAVDSILIASVDFWFGGTSSSIWRLTILNSDWSIKTLELTSEWDNDDPFVNSNTLIFSPINRPDGPLRVLGPDSAFNSDLGNNYWFGREMTVGCEVGISSSLSVSIGDSLSSIFLKQSFSDGPPTSSLLGANRLLTARRSLITFTRVVELCTGDNGLLGSGSSLRSMSTLLLLFGGTTGIYLNGILTCVTVWGCWSVVDRIVRDGLRWVRWWLASIVALGLDDIFLEDDEVVDIFVGLRALWSTGGCDTVMRLLYITHRDVTWVGTPMRAQFFGMDPFIILRLSNILILLSDDITICSTIGPQSIGDGTLVKMLVNNDLSL